MNPQNKPCNCYVSRLPEMARFTVRRGAHEHSCPEYRESRDPMDHLYDNEYRIRHLPQKPYQVRTALERRKNVAFKCAVMASWTSVDTHYSTEWMIHGMALVAIGIGDEELDEELDFLSELAGFRYRISQGYVPVPEDAVLKSSPVPYLSNDDS